VPDGQQCGLLWASFAGIKEGLTDVLERAHSTLCLVLEIAAHSRLSAAISAVQGHTRSLRERPAEPERFEAFQAEVSHLREDHQALMHDTELAQVCVGAQQAQGKPRLIST
jgi:hypothetical protein